MIAVIEYGVGNVSSIVNMLYRIGVPSVLTGNIGELENADKLILPGVGSFDFGLRKLRENGLEKVIDRHVRVHGRPLLGICLGMQMLGRKSEEGIEDGLALIPFENKRFSFSKELPLKIPHMGWDITQTDKTEDPLLKGLARVQRYYFVHSYHAVCDSEEYILMKCEYGYPFAAAVRNGNVYGVQFHPEKSHKFGMALLENFARRI